MKPKIHTESKSLGDHTVVFKGEQYGSDPILDTKVIMIPENGEQFTLCWITWKERDMFYQKLSFHNLTCICMTPTMINYSYSTEIMPVISFTQIGLGKMICLR